MNKTKIRGIVGAIVFMLAGASTFIFSENEVFADMMGGAEFEYGSHGSAWKGGSTGSTSSGCSKSSSCNGFSWIFYESTVNKDVGDASEPIEILFRPDPAANNWPQKSRNASISIECSDTEHKGIGFWHLGQNAISYTNKNGLSYFNNYMYVMGYGKEAEDTFMYSTGKEKWGHLFTHNWGYVKNRPITEPSSLGHELYVDGKRIYTATKSDGKIEAEDADDPNTAWGAFLVAWEAEHGTPYDKTEYPDDLYAFCYWPGMTKAPFRARSSVSNSANGDFATTGIVGSSKTASTSTANLQVNESATIQFSHDVYAVEKQEVELAWSLTRTGLNGGGYTINSKSTVPNGGMVLLATKDGGYYVPASRPYSHNGESHFLGETYNITFTSKGTYEFCEELSFQGIKTKVCTKIAVGDEPEEDLCKVWTPGDYSQGTTSVVSKVRNERLVGAFSGWQGQINGNGITYAKPTDVIYWQSCYYPGIQRHYDTGITEMNGVEVAHHGEWDGCSSPNDTVPFQTVTDTAWSNEYRLRTDSPYGLNENTLTGGWPKLLEEAFSFGDTTIQGVGNNYRTTKVSDVGQEYLDLINTPQDGRSTPIVGRRWSEWHSWRECCGTGCCCSTDPVTNVTTCPCCCWIDVGHTFWKGTHQNGSRQSEAKVQVPYNFTNTASLATDRSLVYAGEEIRVRNAQVNVNKKENKLTEDNYATIVRNAKVRLIAYVSTEEGGSEQRTGSAGSDPCSLVNQKQCAVVNSANGDLNENGNFGGSVEQYGSFNREYNVFDASAGDYMCFAMAVYPSASGKDDNLNASGDDKWYVSAPVCSVIAKRPTFQVYGGSLYAAGSIATSVSTKHNLYGIYQYDPFNKSNTTIFGSWVEQNVTALGWVRLLASGAGAGFSNSGAGTLPVEDMPFMGAGFSNSGAGSGSPEGGSVDYCKNRTPLSFANYGAIQLFENMICPVASLTGSAGIVSEVVNKQALVDFWASGGDGYSLPSNSTVNLATNYQVIPSATGVSVRYTYSTGGMNINGASIGEGVTHIVKALGDVVINGNIVYQNGTFKSAGQIPKVVIYGNNITIACGVEHLDAILIAENNVNTCPSDDLDGEARSHQLRLRGMIVSDSLHLNRTYGTATGEYSGIPAEAINYDTSAILWGRYMAGSGESDTLTVTYQHELAPRY